MIIPSRAWDKSYSYRFCDLIDPDGNTIHQEFDVMGRVVSVTDSLGHSSFAQFDKAGRKTLETDANGNATAFAYDDAGRLKSVTEASGAVTSYTYDRNGNKLTQKDANNHVWSYTYDALNRLTQETDPLNRTMSMTYDPLGNLKTKTDGKGQTTTYSYNIRRLTTTTYADTSADSFTYDPIGRRTGMSNASVSLTYVYDTLNRITQVTNQTYNHVVNYTYDANGNMATRSIVSEGFARQFTDRTVTTKYAYDGKNRLTTITDPLVGAFGFRYDPMDRRTSLTYPNGTSTFYTYDKAYRLSAMATKGASGAVLDAWSYQYDATGNRTSKTDTDGKVEGYSYDNTYRLTEARYTDGTRESFTYDPVGNRTSRTDESGTTITNSYDIANQMLTSGADGLTYDGNGNMVTKVSSSGTTTMSYDAANRVSSIGGSGGNESNVWSPDGRRMQMTGSTFVEEAGLNGNTRTSDPIRPIYDLTGNPIADGDSGNGIRRYRVYGPGIDEPLAETIPGGQTSYLHHDALGSITCATDSTGFVLYRNRYKAFGQRTFTPKTGDASYYTRLSYTSRENSVGGLYQYRSRYYDSGVGRFDQQDSYEGSSPSPPSLHRYVYGFNNPLRFTDPTGHNPFTAATLFAGLLIAAALFMGMIRLGYECFQGRENKITCLAAAASGVLQAVRANLLVGVAGFLVSMTDIILLYANGDIDGVGAFYLTLAALIEAAAVTALSLYIVAAYPDLDSVSAGIFVVGATSVTLIIQSAITKLVVRTR